MPSQAQILQPTLTAQPADLRARAAEALRATVALSAQDPSTFLEYVLRDEMTGKPIRQAPIHEAWHSLISEHHRLVIWSHTESGKSFSISIGRVLWELGRNPNLRIVVLSNTHGQAKKIVRTISRYIETSAELKAVFPYLKPGYGPWTETMLTVERTVISKDPSVQAFGVHGNITGSRVDLVIVDDILDPENTRSDKSRQELSDWYSATVSGRLTEKARVIVVGTAYHPDDLLHRFARNPMWKAFRYPVIDPSTHLPGWPARWSPTRIEQRRIELGPLEFARQMMCEARDDSESRFKQAAISKCMERGEGRRLLGNTPRDYLMYVPLGCQVYTGVDLAVQKKASADLTVFFTIIVHPDSSREVLNILAGRFSGPDIVSRTIDIHKRFQGVMIVESNGAQDYILQFTRDRSAVPVRPFVTGKNKWDPAFGIESLSVELDNAKWIIPNEGGICDSEVDAWIKEMLYYDPKAHTGDRLMASYFAREGARSMYSAGSSSGEVGRVDLMSR